MASLTSSDLIPILIGAAEAIGTISVAYMAYKQMNENNKRTHTIDLISFANKLIDILPDIERSESVNYSHDKFFDDFNDFISSIDKRDVPPLFSIENEPLFDDILFHFSDIKNLWSRFKAIKDYDNMRKTLIDDIGEIVKNKKISSGTVFDLFGGFQLSVYVEIVYMIKGEKSGYDYDIVGLEGKTPVDKKFALSYSNRTHGFHMVNIEYDKIEDIKNMHKSIIAECKKLYKDDIEKIINMEKKLISIRNELIYALEDIVHYPIAPNMNCKYVETRKK